MKKVILGKNKIAYRREGPKSSPKILLLHGLFANSSYFQRTIDFLKQDFDVLAVDFPGFGLSEKLKEQRHTVPRYGRIIKELCDYLDFKPFVLVGASLGGMVGMYLASHYPAYVLKLMLQGTPWNRTCYTLDYSRRFLAFNAKYKRIVRLAGAVKARVRKEFIQMGLSLLRRDYHRLEKEDGVISYSLKYMDLEATAEIYLDLRSRDLSPWVRKIDCPTLIVVGERDQTIPPLKVQLLSKLIRGSKFKRIKGAFHGIFFERPEQMAGIIRKFVGGAGR